MLEVSGTVFYAFAIDSKASKVHYFEEGIKLE